MRSTRSRREPPAAPVVETWGGLHASLLQECFGQLLAGDNDQPGLDVIRSWAAVLSVNKHWRGLAQQMPIAAVCPPSSSLIAWLRRVKVKRLEFVHSAAAAAASGDLACQGFTSSEQRFRAPISTLLATLDFIKKSAATLQVLAGVHPREGILYLTPFQALERISMNGTASEVCKLNILQGLPCLAHVAASGYGEYLTDGLPASVTHLDLLWAMSAVVFTTSYFHLPDHCQLAYLSLSSQRPLCVAAPTLARCASVRISARRAYLGLPLKRGAPWVDVDALAARFAQFMLSGPLECVEVTATRFFVFQPVQDAYDLATNEGLGGIAQQEQLATVLLARHFQSLHVEQRMLAVGAFRAYARITRRRAEPMPFSFSAPLNTEQLDFLQRHALATSISFGPVSLTDAVAVLNSSAFAHRNGQLLQQLQHLEISSELNLAPYSALHSMQGTWKSEPHVPLGPAQLTGLRLTPPLGSQQQERCFQSRWLSGVRQLSNLALGRFAAVDLRHLRVCPTQVHITSLQPPGGQVTPDSLQLPAGGLGAGCALSLRMAYAPPHAIIQGGGAAAAAGGGGQQPHQGLPPAQMMMVPGALAAALQQHAQAAAAAAAAIAHQVAHPLLQVHMQQAHMQPPAEQPQPAGPQDQQAQHQGQGGHHQGQQQQQQAAPAAAAAAAGGPPAAGPAAPAGAGQQQQQGVAALLAQWVNEGQWGLDIPGPDLPPQQADGVAAAAPAQPAQPPQQAIAPPAAVAAAEAAGVADDMPGLESDEDDEAVPGLAASDDEDAAFGPAQADGGGAGGPWVVVQAQQAMQPGQHAGGMDFAQAWAMPDDRLSDVTIRHDALFTSAGSVAVHAGALTVVYTGSGPHNFLQLLAGQGCSPGSSGGGGGMLKTLRLGARSLRFDAVPAKQGDGGQQQAGQQGQGQEGQGVEGRAGSCSGAELRDYINGSEWASVWETKLQRSMFRDQETLVLTRKKQQREAVSPGPAAWAGAAAAAAAAAAPATV